MDPEPDTVDGITDGLAGGEFCRVFWDWSSDEPGVNQVRARIAGVTHLDTVSMAELEEALREAPDYGDQCVFTIGGHAVVIPAAYVQTHADCVRGLLMTDRGT